jgi:hypothetical protein
VIWLMTIAVFAFLYIQTGRWQISLFAAISGAVVYMVYWFVRMKVIMARPEFQLEAATGQVFSPALRVEKFVTSIVIPIAIAFIVQKTIAS